MSVAPLTIRVRLCPMNAENAYWKPLQGKPGIMVNVDADLLWDVVIDCTPDAPAVVHGVRPERFEIVDTPPVKHEDLPLRGWRGVLVSTLLGCVGAAVIIGGIYALRHHL